MARLAILVMATHAAASGDRSGTWSAEIRQYADDDHVSVTSPAVEAELAADESVDLRLGARADIVSAASVDVITQASPAPVREQRLELSAGASWLLSALTAVSGDVIVSHENDYDALRLSLGTRSELAQRNTTLDLRYAAGFDRVGRAGDDSFLEARYGNQLALSLTQILDDATYADLIVDGQSSVGFQASPYRMVPIIDRASSELERVPEVTPRGRHALATLLRLRRALDRPAHWFLHADYRYYVDSWAVTSHTLSGWIVFAPRRTLSIGAQLRGYTQSAAAFYEPYYYVGDDGDIPDLRTRDRTLGRMRSVYAALLGQLMLGDLRLQAFAGGTRFFFLDFPAQAQRTAWFGSLGVAGDY